MGYAANANRNIHAKEMLKLGLVALGGFFGAAGRYLLAGAVHRLFTNATFPYGTLVVNISGCLLIGLFAGLSDSRQLFSPEFRSFMLLGVLGGFTTYSSFGYETFALFTDGEMIRAAANVVLHVLLGLFAVWLGYTAILRLG